LFETNESKKTIYLNYESGSSVGDRRYDDECSDDQLSTGHLQRTGQTQASQSRPVLQT
jgi:hypothetical protein